MVKAMIQSKLENFDSSPKNCQKTGQLQISEVESFQQFSEIYEFSMFLHTHRGVISQRNVSTIPQRFSEPYEIQSITHRRRGR